MLLLMMRTTTKNAVLEMGAHLVAHGDGMKDDVCDFDGDDEDDDEEDYDVVDDDEDNT